jgi:hypothetical protein
MNLCHFFKNVTTVPVGFSTSIAVMPKHIMATPAMVYYTLIKDGVSGRKPDGQ